MPHCAAGLRVCKSASTAGRHVRLPDSACLVLLALGGSLVRVTSPANAASRSPANDPASSPPVTPGAAASSVERPVVNPHDFRYVLNNPYLCHCASDVGGFGGPDLLVWIHTAPLHFKHRTLIRETWGNPLNFRDYTLRVAFFVGDPRNDTAQALLSLEAEKYGDIVQEDFFDSYRNLTYKAIMGLKWVHTYCSGARMILKADDDVMADIFRIVRHVRALHSHAVAREWTVLCNIYVDAHVMRVGKWAVTTDEYPNSTYPPYCPGMALLMTPDLVYPLYLESLHTRYFWVDDVYFSGILARQIRVNFHPLSAIISPGWLKPDAYLNRESDHVFIQVDNSDLFLALWNKMAKLYAASTADRHVASGVPHRVATDGYGRNESSL